MTDNRCAAQRGFTLLETIVALVILSTAVVAFYSLLSTVLNGAVRLEAASTAYDRQTNALELATTLNPMLAPQGRFNLGTYRIAWSSQLLDNVRRPAGSGNFEIGLYRVTLSFPGDESIAPVTVIRLGYRRTDAPTMATGGTTP